MPIFFFNMDSAGGAEAPKATLPIPWGTGQLVPKSTRTLVNSYPFLVNSYLSQLVPKSTRTLVYL